jgi:hypothetical protein
MKKYYQDEIAKKGILPFWIIFFMLDMNILKYSIVPQEINKNIASHKWKDHTTEKSQQDTYHNKNTTFNHVYVHQVQLQTGEKSANFGETKSN